MKYFTKLHISKEIKSYLLGFLFSLVLTIIPFLLVQKKVFSNQISYILIVLFAVFQIIVHFVYFLHLNFSIEKRWNLITLLFVVVIICIVVFGSIWIMSNLNHHVVLC